MVLVDEGTLAEMLGPWRAGGGTLGQRLGRRLVLLVDEGAIPDGAGLPTERALAGRLGVSRSTATAAYRLAKDAGRIESRQGSGSWARGPAQPRVPVPGGTPAARLPENPAFRSLGRPVEGIVDLSLAETRCDAHTRAVLDHIGPDWLVEGVRETGYHPQGLPALREVLSTYLTHHCGHHASPEQVLVTTGAQQGIALTAAVTCPPGATVLVEEASYPGALEVFRRLALRVVPVPADRHGPDPDALASLLARTRPALVYLVPVGNNPTGVVVPAARLDALADALSRSGAVLLEDRTAAPLADPGRTPAPLAVRLPRGTAVVVGSMSKIVWAGVRVGWLLAPPRLLRDLLAARITADLAGSAVSHLLAARLVPHLPSLAAAVRADVAVSQAALSAALAEHLPQWHGDAPDAGAWRWVRLPGDARAVARAAAAAGVLVTPGPTFSPHALLTDHVRIACVEPPEVIAEGVARLGRAWDDVGQAAPGHDDGRDLLLI